MPENPRWYVITLNSLDFFISSSSRPRRSLEIAETLGTELLSHIFSLINLREKNEGISVTFYFILNYKSNETLNLLCCSMN